MKKKHSAEGQSAFAFDVEPKKGIKRDLPDRKESPKSIDDLSPRKSTKVIVPTGFDAPRWPGGPLICKEANLPAFPKWEQALEFLNGHGYGWRLMAKWQCNVCQCWHFWPFTYTPGQDPRAQQYIPEHIIKLIERTEIKVDGMSVLKALGDKL